MTIEERDPSCNDEEQIHPPLRGDGKEDSEATPTGGDRRLLVVAQLMFAAALIGSVVYTAYHPVAQAWEFLVAIVLLVASGYFLMRKD